MADADRQVKWKQWRLSNTFSFSVIQINIAHKVKALMWSDSTVNYKRKKLHLRLNHSEYRQLQHTTGMISHLLTYLHTPWCRVLLEQLTGLQLVKKFPAFHEARMFITALTSVRHLSLSWASPIQSIYPHPTSWRSILILSTHLRLGLPTGLFPPSPHPYAPHAQSISFFSILSPAQ